MKIFLNGPRHSFKKKKKSYIFAICYMSVADRMHSKVSFEVIRSKVNIKQNRYEVFPLNLHNSYPAVEALT